MRGGWRALPLFLSVALSTSATAQLRSGDSLAVIRTVERYHAALAAGDTTALKGMLAYGATVMSDGFAGPLSGRSLTSTIRFNQETARDSTRLGARVFGIGAYVYSISKLRSHTAPGAPAKNEAETIFLSRFGDGWFIEVVHLTIESGS